MIGETKNQVRSNHEIASLEYERCAAAVDKAIAAKEGLIAEIEEKIANMQQIFMMENMNYLALREINQELLYALAKTLKQIKTRYIEAGVSMGFLAERALAFELGKEVRFVKFDYEISALKGLLAGDFLKQDLEMMELSRVLALKQRNHVKHVISLRQLYPNEFANFIQTGVMNFSPGLYDFDKAYPGTYQRRLRRVEVVIHGRVGPEGLTGSLTNFGSFVVRSRDQTMSPKVRRLLPMGKEIRDAFKQLQARGLSVQEVGGLQVFVLPPERLVLSSYDIRQDEVVFPTSTEVREPFEGFGVTGLWRLELPRYLNDVDYRTISDVRVILYFDASYAPELEKKVGGYYDGDGKWVDGLVQKYEQEVSGSERLDQIAFISLRKRFPDAFSRLPDGGVVEFELFDGDFPLYMKEKEIKKLMLRALDKDGEGVQGIPVRLVRLPDGPVIQAKTNGEGWAIDPKGTMDPKSEKLLPKAEFIPLVGLWKIELEDAGQASGINDLVVMFMFDYKERR
jgi:hypothetical protein